MTPPTAAVRAVDTHRLIPSRHNPDNESVLTRLASDDAHLALIFDLDAATNDRLRAEASLLPGITARELVFGIPNTRIVNAAFTHAHPLGSRFNGPDRGAWYAATTLPASQAEIVFHKTTEYAEVDCFTDSVTYDDYLSDITTTLHDLRTDPAFAACLAPDSYVASQALAETLLAAGSLGIVYPSVRLAGGTCIACFRPALVGHVRRDRTYRFTWSGTPEPAVTVE